MTNQEMINAFEEHNSPQVSLFDVNRVVYVELCSETEFLCTLGPL